MFERYSEVARGAIFFARMEAGEAGATSVDTEHLLMGILAVDPELSTQLGIELDLTSFRNRSKQSHPSQPGVAFTIDMPIELELGKTLERAMSIAAVHKCREVRTEHLVASLLEQGGHVADCLRGFGLEEKAMTILLTKIDCNKPQMPTEATRDAMRTVLQSKMFS